MTSLGCPVLCLHHRLALACLFTHTREHYNCLPLLTYCIGSLRFNPDAIRQLGVCWNDAFRKIFNFSRMESVKLLQYFFSCLDFKRYYDLCRWKFLSFCAVTCIFVFCLVSRIPSISTLSTSKTVMTIIHWLHAVRLPLQFTVTLLMRCFDEVFFCMI